MKILISNDDGVHAEGLRVLAEALRSCGEVTVVAPDRNHSGSSHSLTLESPLRVESFPHTDFIAVRGTPTDCVHLAVYELLKPQPEIVVSGINHGANLGDDVLYSGTVAAATEGRYLGLPSIAISLAGSRYFSTAAEYAKKLVNGLSRHPLPADQILNVNVPDLPLAEIKGIRVTRLGRRHPSEPVVVAADPRGKTIYWIGPPGAGQDVAADTDFAALEAGFVSITPLHIDMTAYQYSTRLNQWIGELS